MATPLPVTTKHVASIRLAPHDTILDIITRIRTESGTAREVRVELGENPVFRHYLNIKLLIASFPDKQFVFLAAEPDIRKIGEPLGVKYFYRNDTVEFEESFAKQNILRHNFSVGEYLVYEVKKTSARLRYWIERRSSVYRRARFVSDTNVLLLIIGVALSVGLLLFIFYFAVSRTYVTISPELSVKTVSRNLTYREDTDTGTSITSNDPSVITVHPFAIDYPVDHTFTITAYDTGSTVNAHGTVQIFNELPNDQTFRPNSRLITADGMVYRTQNWINIPAETTESGITTPGTMTADVVADMYDLSGNVIGSHGNIADNVILTFPGLKFNRDSIYARTQ